MDYLIFCYTDTSHKSMFNECHIHLCDCTWLNVFSLAQSLLIKDKIFFECFSCFWKIFCFCKIVKIFKNCVALFWRPSRELVQLHVPIMSPLRDFSRLTSGSMSQLQKILRISFKIWIFFFMFLAAQIGDLFAGGGFSHEGYSEIFAAHFATSSQVELLVAKNT